MAQLMTLGAKAPGGVCLAIPTYGAHTPVLTFALAASIRELDAAGIPYDLIILAGNCHVDDARNSIVRAFMDGDCSALMFIDSDLTWAPEDLVRLVRIDRDVVAGVYPHKQDARTFPVRHLKTEFLNAEADGVIEVEGVPGGFLKISRAAIERLSDASTHYFEQEGDATTTPLIFERSVKGTTRFSGDYTFCQKWRALGGQIYMDPEIRFGHCGEKEWRGCYGAHLRDTNKLPLRGVQLIQLNAETAADIAALHEEWGNGVFAAPIEMIQAAVEITRTLPTGSVILEMGTGLTTLCMAAANPAVTVHALEHDAAWYNRIMEHIARLGLQNIQVHYAPLKDRWYDLSTVPPLSPALVIIDGPPRSQGDRMIAFENVDMSGTLIIDDITAEIMDRLRSHGREINQVGRFLISAPAKLEQAA